MIMILIGGPAETPHLLESSPERWEPGDAAPELKGGASAITQTSLDLA